MAEQFTPQTFAFDRAHMHALAQQHRASFASGDPFPHIVIDDFLPPDVLEAVIEEYPAPEQAVWQEFDKKTEIKLALADVTQMGPATRNLLAEFNGQVFIEFAEQLTGIDHLIPDPHFGGGGLHQIRAGGFLKVHADFNRNQRLQLDRRLNALLYLNHDWKPEYGGALELWNKDMSAAKVAVEPIFNRLVIFATTDFAYHGHPDPLTCPPDRARRSVAFYYYTNGRPEEERSADHTTLFKARPGEEFKARGKSALKQWVPPAISDWLRARRT